MSITQLIVICLAVWRVSHFVAEEDGPYDIGHKIRDYTGVLYDAYSHPYGTNVVSKALLCVWCSSFWFGTAGAIFYALLWQDWKTALWLPMATSGFAALVEKWVNSD